MPRRRYSEEERAAGRAATLRRYREKQKQKRARADEDDMVIVDVWCQGRYEPVRLNRTWTFGEIRKHLCHIFDVPHGVIRTHTDPLTWVAEPEVGVFNDCAYIVFQPRRPASEANRHPKQACDQCLGRADMCSFHGGGGRCMLCLIRNVKCTTTGRPDPGEPAGPDLPNPMMQPFRDALQRDIAEHLEGLAPPLEEPTLDAPPGPT